MHTSCLSSKLLNHKSFSRFLCALSLMLNAVLSSQWGVSLIFPSVLWKKALSDRNMWKAEKKSFSIAVPFWVGFRYPNYKSYCIVNFTCNFDYANLRQKESAIFPMRCIINICLSPLKEALSDRNVWKTDQKKNLFSIAVPFRVRFRYPNCKFYFIVNFTCNFDYANLCQKKRKEKKKKCVYIWWYCPLYLPFIVVNIYRT